MSHILPASSQSVWEHLDFIFHQGYSIWNTWNIHLQVGVVQIVVINLLTEPRQFVNLKTIVSQNLEQLYLVYDCVHIQPKGWSVCVLWHHERTCGMFLSLSGYHATRWLMGELRLPECTTRTDADASVLWLRWERERGQKGGLTHQAGRAYLAHTEIDARGTLIWGYHG